MQDGEKSQPAATESRGISAPLEPSIETSAESRGRAWALAIAFAAALLALVPVVRNLWARGESPGLQAHAPSASAQALLNVSLADYRAGRFRECMEAASQAATMDPRYAAAFSNTGICAANLGLWEEALRNTLEALRLQPDFQLAKNNLAWIREERAKRARPRYPP